MCDNKLGPISETHRTTSPIVHLIVFLFRCLGLLSTVTTGRLGPSTTKPFFVVAIVSSPICKECLGPQISYRVVLRVRFERVTGQERWSTYKLKSSRESSESPRRNRDFAPG